MGREPYRPEAQAKSRTPIQRVLDRLDEALWELNGDEARTPMSNRGMERLVPVSQTQLGRWRNGQPVLRTDVGERFAKAVGLEVGHVLGVLDLPPRGGDWPPPALVRRMMEEHKHAGRPPKPPATPAPTAPPEMHRLVAELRELMAAMRAGGQTMRGGVAAGRPVPHGGPTKVGLAGDDDMDTAERLAAMAERLEVLAEMLATHDATTLGLWEGAAEERRAIVERLERIERILSRPLFECDDGPNGAAAD